MLPVLWRTDQAVAINKPAGLSTQAPNAGESVEGRLRVQLDLRSDYLAFPHRLDRPVSGVLLAALSKKAARLLSQQFATRKTEKIYEAIVVGKLVVKQEEIWTDFLRKVADKPWVEICGEDDAGAKLSRTIVEAVSYDQDTDRTHLRLRPITGRMHQLRVQTASRGHAILGDRIYGPQDEQAGTQDCDESQIKLHARKLAFHDPATGRRLLVEAACPWKS
ncbi:MAG: RluA family pseudouridine synthase [Planctomycetota bacterium]